MLRTDLPEIITDTLPGPKAEAIIERRNAVIPSAIRCGYPVVIKKGEGAMIEDVDGKNIGDVVRNEFRGDAADVAEHDEQDERQAHAARRCGTVVVYN